MKTLEQSKKELDQVKFESDQLEEKRKAISVEYNQLVLESIPALLRGTEWEWVGYSALAACDPNKLEDLRNSLDIRWHGDCLLEDGLVLSFNDNEVSLYQDSTQEPFSFVQKYGLKINFASFEKELQVAQKRVAELQEKIDKLKRATNSKETLPEATLVVENTFEQAWAEKEREGYQYGEEALEQVRFGWNLAMESKKGAT